LVIGAPATQIFQARHNNECRSVESPHRSVTAEISALWQISGSRLRVRGGPVRAPETFFDQSVSRIDSYGSSLIGI
jgi:hypothetical protein